ncbi:hypothetical protein AUJ17_01570 [Candidatus Micrarchaeota archaeon CG1_02_47_40]|nr:MAG: hypothetical protein AUJ17_01570 [Candidatus Micrarchaeota archaeon CG1_02_47_40]
MRAHNYIMQNFQKSYSDRNPEYRKRVSLWRREGTITIMEKPANIARAHALGYKAKESFLVARVKVGRGRRKRRTPSGGRKPARNMMFLSPHTSLQSQAEIKAARKFAPLEVLNSYWVGEDGNYKFFEVILVDLEKEPCVKLQRGRAFRGLTHSGRTHRGIL